MTRIVAGRFGGRRLATPSGRDTRPTSDRVREALFSALDARVDLAGANVADLYAGSGAVALEALSRGAEHALLVEADRRAVRVIGQNVAALGVSAQVRLAADRVERVLAAAAPVRYDVVFADPPYAVGDDEVTQVLRALVDGDWLAPGAVVVVERSARGAALAQVPGITLDGSRRYGETTLWYGRRS